MTLVVLALTPYLILTTALQPLSEMIARDTGLGANGLNLTNGMANAAYAFGAVGGLQLAVRLPVRRLLLALSLTFVIGSVLAAWAPNAGLYVTGRILQGVTTGGMLIAAVPPLVLKFGPEKLPYTAVVMNFGIFGAVALGPVLGGASAETGTWHPFMWIVAAAGALGTLFVLLTYEETPPQDPEAPIDFWGVGLTGAGVAGLFFGISYVAGHHLLSVPVLLPALGGIALIASGLLYEVRARNPLMPIAQLGHTLPLAGIVIACAAGAASVAFIEATSIGLTGAGLGAFESGVLFFPLLGGALLSAIVFGALFSTRWTTTFALSGLPALAGGGVLLLGATQGDKTAVLIGTFLVGLGTGSSVAPALFTAGFSLRSMQLPRVFAMIELLRGVAAFLVGPLLLHLAQTTGGSLDSGLHTATWIGVGIALGGWLLAAATYQLGGARRHPPRVASWLANEGPARDSPPLFARLREVEREVMRGRVGRYGPTLALVAIAGVAVVAGLAGVGVPVSGPGLAVVELAGGAAILVSGLISLFGATARMGGGLVILGIAWTTLGILALVLPPTAIDTVPAVVAIGTAGALLALVPSRRGAMLGFVLTVGAAHFALLGLAPLLTAPALVLVAGIVALVLATLALVTAVESLRDGALRPAPLVTPHPQASNGRFVPRLREREPSLPSS